MMTMMIYLSSRTMCSPMTAQGCGRGRSCMRDGFRNRVTLTFDGWPFDFRVNTCRVLPQSVRTKFGVDSSSRFPFRLRTHTQTYRQRQTETNTQSHRCHWSPYTPACAWAAPGFWRNGGRRGQSAGHGGNSNKAIVDNRLQPWCAQPTMITC